MTSVSTRNRRTSLAALAAGVLACGVVNVAKGGTCPGDTDASGDVNVVDVLAVLQEWGCTDPPGPCAGDVNADGQVNVQDLLMVLLTWGPCPAGGVCDDIADNCIPGGCTPPCGGSGCCAAACAADAGLIFGAQMLAQEAARMFYLPCASIFVSGDEGTHGRLVPLLIAEDQVFVRAAEFRAALQEEADRVESLRALDPPPPAEVFEPREGSLIRQLWVKAWGKFRPPQSARPRAHSDKSPNAETLLKRFREAADYVEAHPESYSKRPPWPHL